ncbi:hypothetical protein [Shewanella colwelliana]|uniref:hypothetical protein n=1 Tax=Shewanella colwelliana TaxID=23 RepID=UPI0022AFDE7A|nr:hypothetical protein [Shewanella colwelliana]MCZ4339864.1 hypothetical protein [Shewanella colwelliana]
MTQKPEFHAPDLTAERLQILSENLLDVLDEAQHYSESPNATAWFKGTANYGLPQGMLYRLHLDSSYPWLTLANQTMDYTIRVGKTLVQFVVDDPHSPRKQHRLRRNRVEQNQFSLELEEDNADIALIWRFYLNPMSNGIDYSPSISLLGFNSNGNIICSWEYDSVITGPIATDKPESVEIDEPLLVRKKKEQKKASNE